MATYRQVKGYSIKSVSSNPDNSNVGQVWYNSSTKAITSKLTISASWASGGNLNSARHALTGFGTQTAALAAAGATSTGQVALVEEYNGTSWSEVNNVNTARNGLAGGGVQTAGLIFGGLTTAPALTGATETYDGTTFTTCSSMALARRILGGAATAPNSAGLGFGGYGPTTAATEEFTGESEPVRTFDVS